MPWEEFYTKVVYMLAVVPEGRTQELYFCSSAGAPKGRGFMHIKYSNGIHSGDRLRKV